MRAIRYQTLDGQGIFHALCSHLEWEGRNMIEAWNILARDLNSTLGKGPCYFTEKGIQRFDPHAQELVRYLEALGEVVVRLEVDLEHWHWVDAFQTIPCVSDCTICGTDYESRWILRRWNA